MFSKVTMVKGSWPKPEIPTQFLLSLYTYKPPCGAQKRTESATAMLIEELRCMFNY